MTIDWSKAPEGATHYDSFNTRFYKQTDSVWYYHDGDTDNWCESVNVIHGMRVPSDFTPRPPEQPSYTRDEALQFLVERLDSWPTDIADAPLCPGWGWVFNGSHPEFEETNPECPELQSFIGIDSWQVARPDFVPFVSLEDAQPAPDMVNHPPHYQSDNGVECIDAIRAALGRDGFVSYCTGNAIKYLWRDKTDRVEDLRKAAWYLNRAIQEVSK